MRCLRALSATLLVLFAACEARLEPAQFVGRWTSTRLTAPLTLAANGEWEIRDEDDKVLQYGVWQLKGRTFVWSVKLDGRLQHDPNAVVSVDKNAFALRERDGSTTRFERIE